MSKYDELKKAAEAATPGPWGTDDPWIVYANVGDDLVYLARTLELDTQYKQSVSDAAFIAAANPAVILALLASHAALLEALKKLDELTQSYDDAWPHEYGWSTDALCKARDAARAAISQAEANP